MRKGFSVNDDFRFRRSFGFGILRGFYVCIWGMFLFAFSFEDTKKERGGGGGGDWGGCFGFWVWVSPNI